MRPAAAQPGRVEKFCVDLNHRPASRSRSDQDWPGLPIARARAAAARLRDRFRPVHDRLPDLRHAQPGSVERDPGLPCADRRPVRRRSASDHRQAGLVGDPGRPRRRARHRPLLPDLRQRAGRLHGNDRSAGYRPGDRRALGIVVSGDHHSRHGARPEAAARPSRHRQPVLRDRRLDGRHAGIAMGGELSRTRLRRGADRRRGAPFGAEHRLSRGRAAGDHGRSRIGAAGVI